MRLQKLAEENDLKLAQEMMGLGPSGGGGVIDIMNPSTKEEFEDLSKAITEKLSNFVLLLKNQFISRENGKLSKIPPLSIRKRWNA